MQAIASTSLVASCSCDNGLARLGRLFPDFIRGHVSVRMFTETGRAWLAETKMRSIPNTENLTPRGLAGHVPWLGWCFCLTVCTAWDAPVEASEPRDASWKTGTEFERQLDSLVAITWPSNPLRQSLSNLSHSQGVVIFLDRRVDPDQEVQFSVPDTALRNLLQGLADHLALGTCRVGSVVYLGPQPTAAVLHTVAAQTQELAQSLPTAVRSRVLRVKPLQWPERSSPRQLIEQLAAEVELKIERPEQIPHDLWPAVALPPLDFAQRLSLLLAGLELTFEYSDAHAIRLLPLPATATVERSYAVSSQQTAALQEVAQRFPEARVTRRAGNVILVAPLEAHELLQGLLHGRRPPGATPVKPVTKPKVLWTLRIENQTVVAVVKTVAKRLECQLACDPALLGKLNQRVSFEVNQVTLEDLLQAALSPAGLTYRLDATTLRILPVDVPSQP